MINYSLSAALELHYLPTIEIDIIILTILPEFVEKRLG